MKRWEITLQKSNPQNRLNEDAFKGHLKIFKTALAPKHELKVKAGKVEEESIAGGGYEYKVVLSATKEKYRSDQAAENVWSRSKVRLLNAARRYGWTEDLSAVPAISSATAVRSPVKQDFSFDIPELNEHVMQTVFGRIYEREPHIRTIYSALQTAHRTKFEKRRHVLMYGQPAAAKSEIFTAFQGWLNSGEATHVLSLDATTTTKAGLERLLLEKSQDGLLEPILYLEEIEKHDIKTLLSLLGVMDSRGTIQRTNARVGNISAECKIVIWATCNDASKLRNFEGSALWSRFNKRLYCARPGEEIMLKILHREASEMGIKPPSLVYESILRFGFDELLTNDPREFIALLDGWEDIDAYLEDQKEILNKKNEEEERLKQLRKDEHEILEAMKIVEKQS